MAPDLPDGFVERPYEFNQLLDHLLDPDRQNPLAITSALHGAGGFGKSTLAAALCRHDDVVTAFVDGILWLTLGDKPNLLEKRSTIAADHASDGIGYQAGSDAAREQRAELCGVGAPPLAAL